MTNSMMNSDNPRAFSLIGGTSGTWTVASQRTVSGDPIGEASSVEMSPGLLADVPVRCAMDAARGGEQRPLHNIGGESRAAKAAAAGGSSRLRRGRH